MKKTLSLILVIMLLSAFLFGCGQGGSDPQAEELCYPGLHWNMTPKQAIRALKLSKGDYIEQETKATSEKGGTYAFGVEHYDFFGVDARIVAEFKDFNADGTYHLKEVTVSFSPGEDMEAIEASLTKHYGEPRPYYETGADWNSEALCKDFLTEAQVKYFSGFTTTADMPDTPITQIYLRTDASYVFYGGQKTNNAVFFASDYSFITLEKGYPVP